MTNVIHKNLLQDELPRHTVIRWALMRNALESYPMRRAASMKPGSCSAGAAPYALCPLGGWGCDRAACPHWKAHITKR